MDRSQLAPYSATAGVRAATANRVRSAAIRSLPAESGTERADPREARAAAARRRSAATSSETPASGFCSGDDVSTGNGEGAPASARTKHASGAASAHPLNSMTASAPMRSTAEAATAVQNKTVGLFASIAEGTIKTVSSAGDLVKSGVESGTDLVKSAFPLGHNGNGNGKPKEMI